MNSSKGKHGGKIYFQASGNLSSGGEGCWCSRKSLNYPALLHNWGERGFFQWVTCSNQTKFLSAGKSELIIIYELALNEIKTQSKLLSESRIENWVRTLPGKLLALQSRPGGRKERRNELGYQKLLFLAPCPLVTLHVAWGNGPANSTGQPNYLSVKRRKPRSA